MAMKRSILIADMCKTEAAAEKLETSKYTRSTIIQAQSSYKLYLIKMSKKSGSQIREAIRSATAKLPKR